ncbi:hypothetical protein [Vulcanisaeta thermophila]|uniref:hypothetical protein n=1 Tax=Vulcanisaeta thermophila TaxID=867917 RepID=UPI0008531CA6|nr:hypothetical protein [Vulcanisaeta thermophila]
MVWKLKVIIITAALALVLTPIAVNATNYLTINYVTYLNPNGQVSNYYIEYTLILYNDEPYQVTYNVTLQLPQYSTLIYATEGYTLVGNEITWLVTLQPYSQYTLEARVKPVYVLLPIATLQFSEFVNGSLINGAVVNGGVGTHIQLNVNVNNELPYPVLTTVSLTRQSGLTYIYNVTPTISQSILGYEVDYWLFNTYNTTNMSIGCIVTDLGPWHSIRINPVTVQVSININESISSLVMGINELNQTLNQMNEFLSTVMNVSAVSGNYSKEFLQLISLLNQTSGIIATAAYLINSTLMVQGLIQAQLVELKVALEAEGQVLGVEGMVISQLRSSLEPIVSNEPLIINTLNSLKQDLETIKGSTSNSTLINAINNAITLINQLEGELTLINNLYNNLTLIQSELSSTQGQVSSAVNGLNYALEAANESEALIISISRNLYLLHLELSNVTNQLLTTYFRMMGYQALALSSIGRVSNYTASIKGLITQDEIKLSVLRGMANYYLSNVEINGTSYGIDVTLEETFIINMPSVVDTQYLQYLLNEAVRNSTGLGGHGSPAVVNPGSLITVLAPTVTIAVAALFLILRRYWH